MNQILITEKLYITPELKRKKKLYKIDFIISVFLICLLFSYYVYAEFDKYSNEKQSQEILASMDMPEAVQSTYVYDDTTIKVEDNDRLVVILSEEDDDDDSEELIDTQNLAAGSTATRTTTSTSVKPSKVFTAGSGDTYYSIAKIRIPKIGLEYGILDHWSDELLKLSPCKYHGADPNEVGNFCIVGHNYRNNLFFSKIPNSVNIGDSIFIDDTYGRTVEYIAYDKHVVNEKDTRDTSQITHGKREITVITCTNDNKNRVIVKAREKE